MWEKRKLTRKSLDELAKILPVLSEDEQRECIGGTRYYDQSGKLIGDFGSNNDVRVVFGDIKDESGNITEDSISSCSIPIYSVSNETRLNIFNTLAKDVGIDSGVKFYFSENSSEHANWAANSGIRVNSNSSTFANGNYYDFTLVLKHEKQHSETPYDAGSAYSEYEAYKKVVEDSNFSKASPEFRAGMMEQYNHYKKLAGM